MWPNSAMPVVNMRDSWGQEVTSVRQKTARGVEVEYFSSSCWASGRRVRSARRTEQPWDRRRDAKEKFMPWGFELMNYMRERWIESIT